MATAAAVGTLERPFVVPTGCWPVVWCPGSAVMCCTGLPPCAGALDPTCVVTSFNPLKNTAISFFCLWLLRHALYSANKGLSRAYKRLKQRSSFGVNSTDATRFHAASNTRRGPAPSPRGFINVKRAPLLEMLQKKADKTKRERETHSPTTGAQCPAGDPVTMTSPVPNATSPVE